MVGSRDATSSSVSSRFHIAKLLNVPLKWLAPSHILSEAGTGVVQSLEATLTPFRNIAEPCSPLLRTIKTNSVWENMLLIGPRNFLEPHWGNSALALGYDSLFSIIERQSLNSLGTFPSDPAPCLTRTATVFGPSIDDPPFNGITMCLMLPDDAAYSPPISSLQEKSPYTMLPSFPPSGAAFFTPLLQLAKQYE